MCPQANPGSAGHHLTDRGAAVEVRPPRGDSFGLEESALKLGWQATSILNGVDI